MPELVILSGKGGTGKTAIASSFAFLAGHAVLADADVDAPNLAIALGEEELTEDAFVGGRFPHIDPETCSACMLCRDVCRFDAIGSDLSIDPTACEGCALCSRVCSEEAIRMEPRVTGQFCVSRTRYGPLVHARLGPGGENNGKLVARVKERARALAESGCNALRIVDGPPGIGCPAIATLSGADHALLVTEPGLSGIHDLTRILELARQLQVRTSVVINRFDIAPELTSRITEECERAGCPVVGRIPFDRAVVDSLVRRLPPAANGGGPASRAIRELWATLRPREHSWR